MNEFTFVLIGVGIGTFVGLLFAMIGHTMIRNEMRRKIDVAVAEVKADMYRAAVPKTHDDRGRGLPQGGTGRSAPRNMWSDK